VMCITVVTLGDIYIHMGGANWLVGVVVVWIHAVLCYSDGGEMDRAGGRGKKGSSDTLGRMNDSVS
jgi:hypothetical protein